jgi:DNA-binding CsgD family transcriptional regulator
MNAPGDRPTICPVVIGRTRELAALRQLIDAAEGGRGQVALISGEAGIGKSRLVAEAKRVAGARGFRIFQGDCFETDSAYPYAPLLDLLRGHIPVDAAEQDALLGEIVRLLPDLAPLSPQAAPQTTPQTLAPDQRKQRLFTAMTRYVTSQAARQPLLLVVEDLHWCDESSLELLLHLARRCADRPVLFLFTLRSEEIAPGLRHWLARIDRAHLADELALVALSRAEVAAMLRAMLSAPDTGSDGLAGAVYALAEGNPFFVEEVIKSLIATGELRQVDGVWERTGEGRGADGRSLVSRSVRDMVQQRANRLSPAARRALTLAAVAGRRFDFALLARALGCAEDELLPLVKELIAAQLVGEESPDRFAFRHALVRQAIYGELLARERRVLHRTLADALERLHTTPARREAHLAGLAYHAYEAGDWERAGEYTRRAGERAVALHAPGAAIEHLTHAIECAQHLGIAPPAAVHHARGQAYAMHGKFDRALADYERALEGAETSPAGTQAWQTTMALGLLWAGRDYAQAGAWFRRASELAARLSDPIPRARSLNRLGNWLSNTGRIEEGLQAHREALAIFEEWDDAPGLAESFDLLGTTYGMRGDKIAAVDNLDRAISLFRALGDAQSLSSSLAMHSLQALPWTNETTYAPLVPLEECERDAAEALQIARQIDAPAAQAFAGNALANALLARGAFGPCLAHALEARRIAAEIGHRQWLVATGFVLGRTYLLLHAPKQAIACSEAALSLARDLGSLFWIATVAANLARSHIVNGNLAAARATLQAVMSRDQPARTVPARAVALAWGELALAESEPAVALGIAERLLASAAESAPGQPAQAIPLLAKLRGEALLALARPDEAAVALEGARRGALERGSRPELWAIHRSLGRAYQRLRREEAAREEFAAARRLIEELATTIDDVPLRDQFQRAALASLPREKPLSRREATRRAFGGLTARECEVASLIVQGKTSREIADLLVITERTAEVHVSNILGKLGFTSRAQIAAWAVERGLGKP